MTPPHFAKFEDLKRSVCSDSACHRDHWYGSELRSHYPSGDPGPLATEPIVHDWTCRRRPHTGACDLVGHQGYILEERAVRGLAGDAWMSGFVCGGLCGIAVAFIAVAFAAVTR